MSIYKTDSEAFTFVEMIIAILIIGIIAALVITKIFSVIQDAEKASEDATIASVQEGIALKSAKDMI